MRYRRITIFWNRKTRTKSWLKLIELLKERYNTIAFPEILEDRCDANGNFTIHVDGEEVRFKHYMINNQLGTDGWPERIHIGRGYASKMSFVPSEIAFNFETSGYCLDGREGELYVF